MAPPKGSDTTPQVHKVENIFADLQTAESFEDYEPRPGVGSAGKVIPVLANMFQARFKNQGKEANTAYHYDVTINPVVKVAKQKMPRKLLWEIWNQLCAEASGPNKKSLDAAAFDMVKNMYTPIQLVETETAKLEFTVALKEDGAEIDDRRRFKVKFALANVIDLNTVVQFCKGERQIGVAKEGMLVAIQAMNVLFRQDATNRFNPVGAQGRRFFGTAGAEPISNGGMVYNGFMQSFRFTSSGLPAIQLDTAYSAFVEAGPLEEVAAKLLGLGGGGGFGGGRGGRGGRGDPRGGPRGGGRGGRGGGPGAFQGGGAELPQQLTPLHIRKLNDVLRMAKFTVLHRKTSRVFTIRGITSQPADKMSFVLNGRDGQPDRKVGLIQYMKEQYNYNVRKPRLPCVQYGAKFYLPLECVCLCEFNAIGMRSLEATQTADMIRVAAKRPDQRLAAIAGWRNTLNYHNLPKVRAWGVEVQTDMMKVNARVLPAPQVWYGGNKPMRPVGGGWNLRDIRFFRPGQPLKSWAILSLDSYFGPGDMENFADQFVQSIKKMGIPVQTTQPPLLSHKLGDGYSNVKFAVQDAARTAYQRCQNVDPQLIVIILPRKEQLLYSTIKRSAAEMSKRPVVTQCLLANKLKGRINDQYLGNVSMKIQVKLGGVTHKVQGLPNVDKNTMVIGADVSHPPQKSGAIPPSIVVTVASANGDHETFLPAYRLQEGRVEIIEELADMTYTQLRKWEAKNRSLPQKIIMFRDGVSEGQYGHCVRFEVPALKDAARRIRADYNPKVTFVICAKRHNMRFFAANPKDADRTGNLPAGTVVDTAVTHPFAFDFYLQAHSGLQGTARPTHYIVVKDENKFTADSMQKLCHDMSYSYARATRSVSLIPVAYYADIIAGKARDFVYNDDMSDTATIASDFSGPRQSATYDPLKLQRMIEPHPEFNEVAWYL